MPDDHQGHAISKEGNSEAEDEDEESSEDELNIQSSQNTFAAVLKTKPGPISFPEAMVLVFSEQWAEAMHSKYTSLLGSLCRSSNVLSYR